MQERIAACILVGLASGRANSMSTPSPGCTTAEHMSWKVADGQREEAGCHLGEQTGGTQASSRQMVSRQ